MPADGPAPIIVKRKKVIEGGHHGGAWKVAYADFVTAMMAFFLLMWLLGATNEKQRKGIADYFNPTIPVNKVSGGGDGAFGGDSIFSESTLAQNGTGAGLTKPTSQNKARGETGADSEADKEKAEDKELQEVADTLSGKGGESLVTDLLQRHVVTRLSDEGLIVEVFDLPEAPLFDRNDEPTEVLRATLSAIAEAFRLSPNEVAIEGHVASVPIVSRENPVWERSALRANRARAAMTDVGLEKSRIQRVTGFADNRPVFEDRLAVRNNRLEIILLRNRI